MKKTIAMIAIAILLLNLISIKSFAADNLVESIQEKTYDFPMETTPQETGTVGLTNDDGAQKTDVGITGTSYTSSQVFKTVANVLTVFPQIINQVLDMFVEVTTLDNDVDKFTIYDTVMGNYNLFDIDYTNISNKEDVNQPLIQNIKYYVIKYYNITRNISIAISLLVLVYIGIRMAITTVASETAKYKKMLINWVASLMLIFILHFLVIAVSVILQKGLQIINNIAVAWKIEGFEEDIYSGAISNLSANGFNVFTTVVLIYVLTWYQVKFFFYYLHRTLEVNFLIIVAPLVTITYSIDKIGDNKAQAFGNFVKEIVSKSAIQLIHAIVYVVFIATAGVIAVSQPLLAIVFFSALSRAEKITRKIFSVNEEGFEKTQVPFT